MTYEEILHRTPASTAAGNLAAAAEFVVFLTSVIEGDRTSFGQLSTSQQRYLYRLRDKWKARAAGDDERWNVYGSRPGRPIATRSRAKKRTPRTDPSEHDPLFQSLVRKYGTPRRDDDDS